MKIYSEICSYNGQVYARDVRSSDTTIYSDYVHCSILWIGGDIEANKAAVDAMIKAVEREIN